ncbi:MAG: hypothetical protein K940chlam2_00672 [Chlamydiae bacterium]|nr:hypothetical protein [Chlamydiota bacterium]
MTIYELFKEEKETFTETFDAAQPAQKLGKFAGSRLFSACVSRLSFLFLLVADLAWMIFSLSLLLVSLVGILFTGGRFPLFRRLAKRALLNSRRSLACGLGLTIGLIAPSFGIMVACTYFLMYDKKGIDEVVPGPIRAQFKELFNSSQP